MILSLQTSERMYIHEIPDTPVGRQRMAVYDENGEELSLIYLEAVDGKWHLCPTKRTRLIEGKNKAEDRELRLNVHYILENIGDKTQLYLCAHSKEEYYRFTKYYFRSEGRVQIRIGNSPSAELYYAYPLLQQLITLQKDKGTWAINCRKEPGIYINGRIARPGRVFVGDRIYIRGLILIIGQQFISMNQPEEPCRWKEQLTDLNSMNFQPELAPETALKEWEAYEPSPRINKKSVIPPVYTIDPPPDNAIQDELPMPMVVGPSVTMAMASLSTGALSAVTAIADHNLVRAVPAITMAMGMLGGSIVWPLITKSWKRKQQEQKEQERQTRYHAYLKHFEDEFIEEGQRQKAIWEENYIPVKSCLTRVNSSMLWNRNRKQDDFLSIRVGTGTGRIMAQFEFPEKHFNLNKDNLLQEMRRLEKSPRLLEGIPIACSLAESPYWGIVGERADVVSYTKGILVQLATYYGYQDVRLVFLLNQTEENTWSFCRWLPHCWNNDKTFRYVASNEVEVLELSALLEKEFDKRLEAQKGSSEDAGEPGGMKDTAVITVVADRRLARQAAYLKHVLQTDSYMGFGVLYLADNISCLPPECTHIFEIHQSSVRVSNIRDGQAQELLADIQLPVSLDALAGKLFMKKLSEDVKAFELPATLTYQQYFGIHDVRDLDFGDIWVKNDSYLSLRAALGVDENGNTCYLDIHEKAHGPHGLVAGMTGSGKSEFILTYLLSLAMNYHPDDISFVLIDYKGGGMADTFAKLPHTAGIITNLDGSMIHRSLVSLESELKRREHIFREASAKLQISNIDIYKYQKAYHNGQVAEALPHLLIISDEFAELKSQQPEFMTQLVSTARIGRSLGVHLILATQKPSGVVNDQIWSNSRFHICLKVQDEQDSKEMLRRTDAAYLVERGRFYLQVGNDEVFIKGQSAWSGADYEVLENTEFQTMDEITLIDRLGRTTQRLQKKKARAAEAGESKKQIDIICKAISRYGEQKNLQPHRMWLDPIPKVLYLEELGVLYPQEESEPYLLDVLLGEYDIPKEQKRGAFRMTLTQAGNVQIVGMQGSGAENFLETLGYALIQNYAPEWLHLYILDFGSRVMKGLFQQAPQVGDVVEADDEERVGNLFRMLTKELAERRKRFADRGGSFLSWCRMRQASEEICPNIVVMINNYAGFAETYEKEVSNLVYLSREGGQYGITFIVTAVSASVFRTSVSRYYNQRYALQFENPVEYMDVVGNTRGMSVQSNPARGLFRGKDKELYEFQVALRIRSENMDADVRSLCRLCKDQYQTKARPIPILPEHVSWRDMPVEQTVLKGIAVGISARSIRPCRFNLKEYTVHVTLAARQKLVNRFFVGMAEALFRTTKVKIVVMDFCKCFDGYPVPEGILYYNQDPIEAYTKEIEGLTVRANRIARGEIQQVDPVIVLIPSFSAWVSACGKYPEKGKARVDTIQTLFAKFRAQHGAWFLLGDTAAAAKEYGNKTWFPAKRGLWIGDGITNQSVLNGMAVMSVARAVRNGYEKGYLITEEKSIGVKVLQPEHIQEDQEEEDDE